MVLVRGGGSLTIEQYCAAEIQSCSSLMKSTSVFPAVMGPSMMLWSLLPKFSFLLYTSAFSINFYSIGLSAVIPLILACTEDRLNARLLKPLSVGFWDDQRVNRYIYPHDVGKLCHLAKKPYYAIEERALPLQIEASLYDIGRREQQRAGIYAGLTVLTFGGCLGLGLVCSGLISLVLTVVGAALGLQLLAFSFHLGWRGSNKIGFAEGHYKTRIEHGLKTVTLRITDGEEYIAGSSLKL